MPKAVQYERFGDPSVLEVVEVPEVHPGEGKVRIAVRAAGLNPFDFKMRSGLVPIADPKFPRGIGGDFAGVVDEVGEGAQYADGSAVAVGDEVLGWGDRVVREQLVVAAKNLARKPPRPAMGGRRRPVDGGADRACGAGGAAGPRGRRRAGERCRRCGRVHGVAARDAPRGARDRHVEPVELRTAGVGRA